MNVGRELGDWHRPNTGRSSRLAQRCNGAALIAVAAIGVYSMFGETVKKQTGAMAAALAGALKRMGILNRQHAPVRTLSQGQRRPSVARWRMRATDTANALSTCAPKASMSRSW